MEQDKKNSQKKIYYLLAITLAILGVYALSIPIMHKKNNDNCTTQYPLLSQDIDCNSLKEKISRVKSLESDVAHLIDTEKSNNNITSVSVFYRDLNSRQWFGINADENFYPASLLKLPIAITYFKQAEQNPEILTKKIALPITEKDQNDNQYFKIKNNLDPGKEYTIEELIASMLINSDNNPLAILRNNMADEYKYNVFRDIGLAEPIKNNEENYWSMTVRIYASILRSLFISSYLEPQYSNRVLEYLTNSTFNLGIRAAVPSNITVAQKFGEAKLVDLDGTVKEYVLHDCGIVYEPGHPYILCVMTRGNTIEHLTQMIQNITKIVHNENSRLNNEDNSNIYDDE